MEFYPLVNRAWERLQTGPGMFGPADPRAAAAHQAAMAQQLQQLYAQQSARLEQARAAQLAALQQQQSPMMQAPQAQPPGGQLQPLFSGQGGGLSMPQMQPTARPAGVLGQQGGFGEDEEGRYLMGRDQRFEYILANLGKDYGRFGAAGKAKYNDIKQKVEAIGKARAGGRLTQLEALRARNQIYSQSVESTPWSHYFTAKGQQPGDVVEEDGIIKTRTEKGGLEATGYTEDYRVKNIKKIPGTNYYSIPTAPGKEPRLVEDTTWSEKARLQQEMTQQIREDQHTIFAGMVKTFQETHPVMDEQGNITGFRQPTPEDLLQLQQVSAQAALAGYQQRQLTVEAAMDPEAQQPGNGLSAPANLAGQGRAAPGVQPTSAPGTPSAAATPQPGAGSAAPMTPAQQEAIRRDQYINTVVTNWREEPTLRQRIKDRVKVQNATQAKFLPPFTAFELNNKVFYKVGPEEYKQVPMESPYPSFSAFR